MQGVTRRDGHEKVLARPSGHLENAETATWRRGPGVARQTEGRGTRYTSSLEEEEVDARMCPCRKAIESRTHIVGEECERYQEERDAPREETKEIYEYE